MRRQKKVNMEEVLPLWLSNKDTSHGDSRATSWTGLIYFIPIIYVFTLCRKWKMGKCMKLL